MKEYDFEQIRPVMEYRRWESIRLRRYVQSLALPVGVLGSQAKDTNASRAAALDALASSAALYAGCSQEATFNVPIVEEV